MRPLLKLTFALAAVLALLGHRPGVDGCPITRERANQMARQILTEYPDLINTVPYGGYRPQQYQNYPYQQQQNYGNNQQGYNQ